MNCILICEYVVRGLLIYLVMGFFVIVGVKLLAMYLRHRDRKRIRKWAEALPIENLDVEKLVEDTMRVKYE